METTAMGLYRDNGKENGSYYNGFGGLFVSLEMRLGTWALLAGWRGLDEHRARGSVSEVGACSSVGLEFRA